MTLLREAQCTQCTASFSSAKRLNEHVKRNHSEASTRTCPHCDKVFKNAASLPRHVKQCDQWPELQFPHVTIPPSRVPVRASDGHAKAPVHTPRGLVVVEEYVGVLKAYLNVGHFIYSFATKCSSLAPMTVTSYCSFVCKYLKALHCGLVASAVTTTGHHHEEEEEEGTCGGQRKAGADGS